jgi:hypothetical protein
MQVFDQYGKEGRPIGVIEADSVVRVNDILGDWLFVDFDGGKGWMLNKYDSTVVMEPACREKQDFWKNLIPYHEPVFYFVRFELPEKIQVKVRCTPEFDGKVCGSLSRGMVVACGAMLNNTWLQVRFNEIDAAWVTIKSATGILFMEQVHESLQIGFTNVIKQSPVTMKPEDLLPIIAPVEEVEERPDTARTYMTATSVNTRSDDDDSI